MLEQLKKKENLIIASIVLVSGLLLFRKKNPTYYTQKSVEEEFNALPGETTLSIANLLLLADKLQAAMFDVGTDEDAIFNVFSKIKTAKDLLGLIKSFGVRPYYEFGFNTGNYNLAQWLGKELNDSEIEKVNDILKSNNITFSF